MTCINENSKMCIIQIECEIHAELSGMKLELANDCPKIGWKSI